MGTFSAWTPQRISAARGHQLRRAVNGASSRLSGVPPRTGCGRRQGAAPSNTCVVENSSDRTRTCDPGLMNPLLCQLSYAATVDG